MQRKITTMGPGGDAATLWRSDADIKGGETLEKGEVDEARARAVFAEMTGRMAVPFAVEAGIGERALTEFDPDAEEILFVSRIAGGYC